MSRKGRLAVSLAALLSLAGMFVVGVISPGLFLVLLAALGLLSWQCLRSAAPAKLLAVLSLVLSTGATVTAADLFLRSALLARRHYRPHEKLFRPWPWFPASYRYEENAAVSLATYGDLAALSGDEALREPRTATFVTDAYGFRNVPSPHPGAYEVVVLGDSFAAGEGTSQERTWASLLASRYGLRVYNLAVPGSPWQSWVNLAAEIPRLRLRAGAVILLLVFPGNDLEEPYGAVTPELRLNSPLAAARSRFAFFRSRSALRLLLAGALRSGPSHVLTARLPDGRALLFFKPYLEPRGRSRKDVAGHPSYPRLLRTLEAIQEIAAAHSAKLQIVLVPMKEEIYGWVLDGTRPWSTPAAPSGFSLALAESCRDRGIEFFDLGGPLRARARERYEASGQLLWWTDDTHWNEAGNAVVAEIVYRRVLRPEEGSGAEAPDRAPDLVQGQVEGPAAAGGPGADRDGRPGVVFHGPPRRAREERPHRADEVEGNRLFPYRAAGLGDGDLRRVDQPAAGPPAQQGPGGLLHPDGGETVLRPRQVPLQEVGVPVRRAIDEDTGVGAPGEPQPRARQEMPGAERIGVLAVGHEQRPGAGRQPEKAGEGAQEEDVRVAEGQLRAGAGHRIDQLERQGALPPVRRERRAAGQERGDPLVRLDAGDQLEPAEPGVEAVQVLRGQRAVVVEAQRQRLGRAPQQAPQAEEGHVHLPAAEEARDPARAAGLFCCHGRRF